MATALGTPGSPAPDGVDGRAAIAGGGQIGQEGGQLQRQRPGARLAGVGGLGQRLEDHPLQPRVDLGEEGAGGGGGSSAWAMSTSKTFSALKGSSPGDQVVEEDAAGVEVAARVDRLAGGLLGRHVRGRARPAADDGERRAGRALLTGPRVDALVGRSLALEDLGDAEVEHLDEVGPGLVGCRRGS